MARPIRVLVAKLGLDAHTIGVTVVAKAMRAVLGASAGGSDCRLDIVD